MIRVPGEGKPHVPPPISPKEAGKEVQKEAKEKPAAKPAKGAPAKPGIGRGPELDARALAVRLAALATEAKEKEIGAEEFERILEEVIKLTGLKDPQAALEEANKRLQKEILLQLEKIKSSKGLMEEAQDWQKFAELLTQMNKEQIQSFLGLLNSSIREL
jgi:DNA primase